MMAKRIDRSSPPFDRTVLGLFAASLAGSMVGTIVAAVTTDWLHGAAFIESAPALALAALLGSLLVLPFSVLLGWPLHLTLKSMRKSRAFAYGSLGCTIGFVAVVLLLTATPTSHSYRDFVLAGLLGAAIGGVSATAFWLIRRPDRDTRPSLTAVQKDPKA